MYCEHFGLRLAPFSIAPDPRFLYMSPRHREALVHLRYGLQAGGGFVLLTGDIGCGKTTLCRSLLQQTLPRVKLAYVLNPRLDTLELLQTVCEEFHLPLPTNPCSLKGLVSTLNTFLLQAHADDQRCVLIIDEAQNLSADVLEQLRLLTNLETSEHKLLQIILIGQPELRDLLDQPALEQLAQRVIARYHLQALDRDDTRRYIQHRLNVAGHQGPLPFSESAVNRIHRLTQGVPRRINQLCDRALLGAFGRRQQQVDAALVDLAATEILGQPPARTSGRKLQLMGIALVMLVTPLAWWILQDRPTTIASHATPASRPPPVDEATLSTPMASETPAALPSAVPPLAALPDDLNRGLQALGLRWDLQLPERGVCDAALMKGIQCFRSQTLTLDGLRRLDRPGLLRLHDNGVARWVLADALHDEALLLRAADQQWKLPLEALPMVWRGEYATFWRLPPGQRTRVFTATAQDPAGRWLSRQLDDQLPPDPTADFTARVRSFQQRHGLYGDGRALPSTFLLINLLSNVDEPRLRPRSR